MLDGRAEFIRSGLWSVVLRIGGLLSGFALGVVLARTLGPAEFGIYGLATTAAALANTVAQMGTPQLAVREFSARAARGDWPGIKRLIRSFGIATICTGLCLGAVALVIGLLVGSPSDDMILIAEASILAVLTALTGLLAAEMRGLGYILKGQSIDIAVRPAVAFLVVGALLLVGSRVDAHLALRIQIIVSFLAAILSAFWVAGAIPPAVRSNAADTRVPWVKFAIPLLAVDALRQLDGSYGVILVGWLSSGVDLGVFRVAFACFAVAAMPVTIFHVVQAPTISRFYHEGRSDELQKLLTSTSALLMAVLVPLAGATWLLGRPLLILVFGAPYANAWLPLFWMVIAQLIYGIFGMGPILLAMCGGERTLTRIYAVGVGSAVVGAVVMTWKWGGAGAAAAQLISALIVGLGSRRYGMRHLDVDVCCVPVVLRRLRHRNA